MMIRWLIAAALTATATGGGFGAGTASAAEFDPGKAALDMTPEEASATYSCLKDALYDGYQAGDKRWIPDGHVSDYRDWKAATAYPAAPGFHGGRFLTTYVNEVGFDAYVEYAEDPEIPAGTVIAKESFSVTDAGEARAGPLFLMEKVAAGESPETGDWHYMVVAPNGAPQAVNVISACSACHQENFGFQGGLGYPVEAARLK